MYLVDTLYFQDVWIHIELFYKDLDSYSRQPKLYEI